MIQSQIALENTVGIVVSVERSIHHPRPLSTGTLCHSSIIFCIFGKIYLLFSQNKNPETKLCQTVSVGFLQEVKY